MATLANALEPAGRIIVFMLIAGSVLLGVTYYATIPAPIGFRTGVWDDLPTSIYVQWCGDNDYYGSNYPSYHNMISMVAGVFLLDILPLLGSLWVFRLAGYRLVFRRGAAT